MEILNNEATYQITDIARELRMSAKTLTSVLKTKGIIIWNTKKYKYELTDKYKDFEYELTQYAEIECEGGNTRLSLLFTENGRRLVLNEFINN